MTTRTEYGTFELGLKSPVAQPLQENNPSLLSTIKNVAKSILPSKDTPLPSRPLTPTNIPYNTASAPD